MTDQIQALRAALEDLLALGRKDTSNPKYDSYYEEARAALAASPAPQEPIPCGVKHLGLTGARCELPTGHTGNHRGTFGHGHVTQWSQEPTPASFAAVKLCHCGSDDPVSARYGHPHLSWCGRSDKATPDAALREQARAVVDQMEAHIVYMATPDPVGGQHVNTSRTRIVPSVKKELMGYIEALRATLDATPVGRCVWKVVPTMSLYFQASCCVGFNDEPRGKFCRWCGKPIEVQP